MRPFLIAWNAGQTEVWLQQILDYLDTRPEVKNYYAPFVGTILVITDENQSPSSVAALLHHRFGTLGFAVVPADKWSTNGWMPQVFWDLINRPWASGRWPVASGLAGTPPPSMADLVERESITSERRLTLGDLLTKHKKE